MITLQQFQHLAQQGYRRIPLVCEVVADLETPLSIYLKLTQDQSKNTFLLESVVGGERFGRYSYVGLTANTRIKSEQGQTVLLKNHQIIETHDDPFALISAFQTQYKTAPLPIAHRFAGGLAGYFSYDTVRYIEEKLRHTAPPDALGLPDIYLLCCEQFAIIDNLSGKLHLIIYADPAQPNAYSIAQAQLTTLKQKLHLPLPESSPQAHPASTQTDAITRTFTQEEFINTVHIAKEAIFSGELMQVQIGQRIKKPFAHSPIDLYRALRSLNPSPYLYYYNFDDEYYVVGSSPEILVRQEDAGTQQTVTIRPLAGTRKRGQTDSEDQQLAQALLNDPKERAEHLMLIDLARNDIGRIAQPGSVKVTHKMEIEKYSHVQHIVSEVQGTLRPECHCFDILRACFPAGTLSGAPKLRAMQLIDELEPVKRNLYGGAIGYLSFSGEMDLAIAIRTGLIYQNHLYVQASAGIVTDSDPQAEWQETEDKARALLQAAQWVEQGHFTHTVTTTTSHNVAPTSLSSIND